MDRLALLGVVLMLAAPASALAASPFDGTWKTDPKTIASTGKPMVTVLKDGVEHFPDTGRTTTSTANRL